MSPDIRETGDQCPCGEPWLRHYHEGRLVAVQCRAGHQPFDWLTRFTPKPEGDDVVDTEPAAFRAPLMEDDALVTGEVFHDGLGWCWEVRGMLTHARHYGGLIMLPTGDRSVLDSGRAWTKLGARFACWRAERREKKAD